LTDAIFCDTDAAGGTPLITKRRMEETAVSLQAILWSSYLASCAELPPEF